MIKRSEEDIKKIVEKWSHVLTSPLSSCSTVMLLESQEKVHTVDEVINSISSDVFDQYVEKFKHDGDTNPDGYISILVKHKIKNDLKNL